MSRCGFACTTAFGRVEGTSRWRGCGRVGDPVFRFNGSGLEWIETVARRAMPTLRNGMPARQGVL